MFQVFMKEYKFCLYKKEIQEEKSQLKVYFFLKLYSNSIVMYVIKALGMLKQFKCISSNLSISNEIEQPERYAHLTNDITYFT